MRTTDRGARYEGHDLSRPSSTVPYMKSDGEWGFLSESEKALVRRLRAEVGDAVSEGSPSRLVLRGGEVLERIPDRVHVDLSDRPRSANSPRAVKESALDRPVEVVIDVAGTPFLAQDVQDFSGFAGRSRPDFVDA